MICVAIFWLYDVNTSVEMFIEWKMLLQDLRIELNCS
jgi:hypothetical protein